MSLVPIKLDLKHGVPENVNKIFYTMKEYWFFTASVTGYWLCQDEKDFLCVYTFHVTGINSSTPKKNNF